MSRFVIRHVKSGPSDLIGRLPIEGHTYDVRTTGNGSTFFGARLDPPLELRIPAEHEDAGQLVSIDEVVFRAHVPGDEPHYGMRGFAIDLDCTLGSGYLDHLSENPASFTVTAVVEIDDADDGGGDAADTAMEGETDEAPAAHAEAIRDAGALNPVAPATDVQTNHRPSCRRRQRRPTSRHHPAANGRTSRP